MERSVVPRQADTSKRGQPVPRLRWWAKAASVTVVCLCAAVVVACGGGGGTGGGGGSGIAAPSPGQWVCYHCTGMSLNSDGSFTFPGSGGAVGYIYTGVSGNPAGKTITLNYTVSGSGTVLPSPASGVGNAQVRLFLWRKNDDVACTTGSSGTEWYRWWAASAGQLTVGTYQTSAPITYANWTDCFHNQDAGQFAGTTANLLGAGFTFGAEFFGHGVYSTGSNTFKVNNFTVQ